MKSIILILFSLSLMACQSTVSYTDNPESLSVVENENFASNYLEKVDGMDSLGIFYCDLDLNNCNRIREFRFQSKTVFDDVTTFYSEEYVLDEDGENKDFIFVEQISAFNLKIRIYEENKNEKEADINALVEKDTTYKKQIDKNKMLLIHWK